MLRRTAAFAVAVSLITCCGKAAAQDTRSCRERAEQPAIGNQGLYWNGADLPDAIVREYLGLEWSHQAIAEVDVFPAREMIAAIAAVGDKTEPAAVGYLQYETYMPPTGYGSVFDSAYDEAAGQYRAKNFAESIPLFDKVAADPKSPYRAAAAYTAARAALLLGRYEDGINRIDRLVANDALAEFHGAAHKLIGTLSYQFGSKPLFAARFAQIAHLLATPSTLLCRYPVLAPLVAEAGTDMGHYASIKANDPRAADDGPPISAVMDALAAKWPSIDLDRVLWARTPFAVEAGWLEDFDTVDEEDRRRWRRIFGPGREVFDSTPLTVRAKVMTVHAKQRWLETKNVLWAYALARRSSDVADVAIIKEAIAALRQPSTPAAQASHLFLRRALFAQGVRLLLMSNQVDEALAFLGHELAETQRVANLRFDRWHGPYDRGEWSSSYVLNGGIRLFLEQRDLETARRWAHEAAALLDQYAPGYRKMSPESALTVLLAQDVPELVATVTGGEGGYSSGDRAFFAVVDLLPARTLVEMSAKLEVRGSVRRALLGAGWVRLYLLGREDEALALLPRLRELFPELAGDIDDINAASFDFAKRHAVTRMLLRAPGLSPRTLWARGTGYQAKPDIFVVNGANPNDGNWWCPLDQSLLKTNLLHNYWLEPLRRSFDGTLWFPAFYAAQPELRQRQVARAESIAAWHPLFKLIDERELEALSRVDSGPKMLSEQAVAWADWSNAFTWALGFDEKLPETLHLAVRSTRYGCRRNGGHGAYSRAAFNHLHDSYPSSEWAKKTPHWFDTFRRY